MKEKEDECICKNKENNNNDNIITLIQAELDSQKSHILIINIYQKNVWPCAYDENERSNNIHHALQSDCGIIIKKINVIVYLFHTMSKMKTKIIYNIFI